MSSHPDSPQTSLVTLGPTRGPEDERRPQEKMTFSFTISLGSIEAFQQLKMTAGG